MKNYHGHYTSSQASHYVEIAKVWDKLWMATKRSQWRKNNPKIGKNPHVGLQSDAMFLDMWRKMTPA